MSDSCINTVGLLLHHIAKLKGTISLMGHELLNVSDDARVHAFARDCLDSFGLDERTNGDDGLIDTYLQEIDSIIKDFIHREGMTPLERLEALKQLSLVLGVVDPRDQN